VIEAAKDRLPSGWTFAELRDLFDGLQYGYTASAIGDSAAIKFLRITDIQNGSVDWSTVPGCAIEDAVRPRYLLADGDFVFARTGSIEKAWRVRNPPSAVFASYLIRGRLCDSQLGDWLRYFVESPDYISQAVHASAGIGRPNVNAQSLGRFQIRIAPLPEQRRIITILESLFPKLDAAVAALERARANLKRYRASVLKAAVEGRLVSTEAELARKEGRAFEPASVLLNRILAERRRRWEESELARMKAAGKPPKDDRWKSKYKEPGAPDTSTLPQLPVGWCWASIEQLSSDLPRSIQSGPFGSHLHHSEFQADGKLVIGIDNVQDGFFSLGAKHRIAEAKFERLKRFAVRPNDVLVTVMATIGRTCVVPEQIEPAIVTKHVYRISAERTLVSPMYLHLALWGGDTVRAQMFGNARGQTRPGLNGRIIKRLAVPIPPITEQTRIVEKTDELLSLISHQSPKLEQSLMRIEGLRQSILKWAFEGKLADQNPTDEPASVLLERTRAERTAVPAQSRKSQKTVKHEAEAAK
jgi:type I restriction enzyme S subunit